MLSTALCNFEPKERYRRKPVAVLNPTDDIAAGLLKFRSDKAISPQPCCNPSKPFPGTKAVSSLLKLRSDKAISPHACCDFEPKWRYRRDPVAIPRNHFPVPSQF